MQNTLSDESAPPSTLNTETAVLVNALRGLYCNWRYEARKAESDEVRAAYQRAMDDLERVLGTRSERMAAWQTMKSELVTAFIEATEAKSFT